MPLATISVIPGHVRSGGSWLIRTVAATANALKPCGGATVTVNELDHVSGSSRAARESIPDRRRDRRVSR